MRHHHWHYNWDMHLKCATILKSKGLQESDKELEKKADGFNKLCDVEWHQHYPVVMQWLVLVESLYCVERCFSITLCNSD